jgi:LacI family transcriptional regulator
MAAAMRFIQEHACDPITVRDVVRHVSMSRRGLEHRFEKAIGRAPGAEIRRVQVERARILLAETDMKVPVVGASVGLAHYRSFSRLFQRFIGLTPGQYRRKLRD